MSPLALLSVTYLIEPKAATAAIGTLTSRHQRHEAYSVSTPPRISPMAAPPPEIAPYTAKARARSWLSVKVTLIRDNAAGASRAAKTPCRARAENSSSAFWAIPPSAEAMAKPASPMMKVRLRPT